MTLGIVDDASREMDLGYSQYKGGHCSWRRPLCRALVGRSCAYHLMMDVGFYLGQIQSMMRSLFARLAGMEGMLRIFWNGSLVKMGGGRMGCVPLRIVSVGVRMSCDDGGGVTGGGCNCQQSTVFSIFCFCVLGSRFSTSLFVSRYVPFVI